MTTPQDNTQDPKAFRRPDRLPSHDGNAQNIPSAQPLDTNHQNAVSQFRLPTPTSRQNAVSQFRLPTPTSRQNTVSPQPPTPTSRQNVVSQFNPLITNKFNAPPPVQPATNNQSTSWIQPATASDSATSWIQPSTTQENSISWIQSSTRTDSATSWIQPTTDSHNTTSWIQPTTDSRHIASPAQPTTDSHKTTSWIQETPADKHNSVSWIQPSTTDGHRLTAQPNQLASGNHGAFLPKQLFAAGAHGAALPDQSYIANSHSAALPNQTYIANDHNAAPPEQFYTTNGYGAIQPNLSYAVQGHSTIAQDMAYVTNGHNEISHAYPAISSSYSAVSQSIPTATGHQTSVSRKVPEISIPPLEKGISLLSIIINVALVMMIISIENNRAFVDVKSSFWPGSTTASTNDITNNKDISPYVFGTNMALFHDDDELMLNSPATRQLLKDIGVRIIRMPSRTTLQPATEIAAANAIKAIGAAPLVVLRGPELKGIDLVEENKKIINRIRQVFGDQTVYYEFGNESDLQGVKAEQYVESWNMVIPALKQLSPSAKFIGPDMYQFNRRYIKTFLLHANPRPDGISWHAYTCSIHWTKELCLANLDAWPMHFAQARAAMQEAIGTTLPIWITEWNYAPDQALNGTTPIDDGKYNDPEFMKTWTTRAMKYLIENRIFASMQYFATNPPMTLIHENKIGIEGEIFKQNYQQIMVDGKTPPENLSPAPIMAPQVKGDQVFSFEDGSTSGWIKVGESISDPKNTTTRALDGTHSIQMNVKNATEDDTPYITVPAGKLPKELKAEQMVNAHVFVANKNAIMNAKIFVADSDNEWHFASDVTLTSGTWQRLWYALPINFNKQITEIGIQFYTATPGASSDIFIDAISWN